ncbi:MAG: DUF1565 domain-containing protein [Chloroflexi bacterium]|nr:MAG: DUF1565 domain-containing protein [Chloroflexota bacterium]
MSFQITFLVVLTLLSTLFNPLSAEKSALNKEAIQTKALQSQPPDQPRIFIPLVMRSDSGFYVAESGSDSNPGTFNAPWRTLQHAIGSAPSGATIYVRAGNYTGFVVERTNLTISGYPGETPSILPDGTNTYTAKIMNSSNIHITGLSFHDNWKQYGVGVYIEGSRDVTVRNSTFFDNQGFGVVTKNVTDVLVEGNDLFRNANAIEIRYGSSGVVITGNQIHDNFREVDGGRGAIGVTFYRTTGPVTAIGNRLWNNHSIDKVDPEGAAFEVYAGGNVAVIGNEIWDNETVLETGTKDQAVCSSISFVRNIVYRGSRQQGLILRCASNSLFAHNIFDGLDEYVFYLTHFDGQYGASIEGLRIVNNIAINGRVYSIGTAMPATVEIDHNLVYNPGSDSIRGDSLAYVYNQGNTMLLSEFQLWTGYDLHSLSAAPAFVNSANHDYRPLATSPAIDLGEILGESYSGAAPDAGAYEYTP